MKDNHITWLGLTLKTIAAHTITYFLVGLVAFTAFNYAADSAQPELRTFMSQTDDTF